MQEAGEERVRHVVVEERPLVHQDALDVLAEGRVLAQQLHTGFSQNGLKSRNKRQHKPTYKTYHHQDQNLTVKTNQT